MVAYNKKWLQINCGILTDEGYQGATLSCRVIYSANNHQKSLLSASALEINRQVSSDWNIVENVLGRRFSLSSGFSHKWKWNQSLYDTILKIGDVLTSLHVKKCPLRSEDLVYFSRVRNRLRFIRNELFGKRKRQHEKFVARCRQRMISVVADLSNESESN